MNKRRKYDIRNKRSFIIILVLAIAIVAVFSFFIYKYTKTSKIEYVVESGSVLQDVLKNNINVDDEATLKIRWNDNYYLVYNEDKINLGNKVIIYNSITGGMKLYGDFYEILSDGKIIENKKETVLANTTDCKFYKLDDRKYLLVDTKIVSDDYSIDASSYLLVELDKQGNAKLSNNKVNLKTISPTTLVTSKYTFDIANELLRFGDYEIDLKKIIGSTNQYVPENMENSSTDDDDENNQENNEVNNNLGIGTGNGLGNGGVVNGNDNGNTPEMDEILNKVKMTSIIRVVEGLTQIDVDYVIYDPYNEYKTVYVEVISAGKIDVVYLSKTDTHLTLNNLNANTDYKLNFVYTTGEIDEDTGIEELVPHTFEQFELKTRMPEYSISVYKISKVYNTLTYKVNLQSGFNIEKVNVNLLFDYNEVDTETGEVSKKSASIDGVVEVNNVNSTYVLGNFDISNYEINEDTLLRLTIKSVVASSVEIPVNSSSTFRFGR